MTVNKVAEMVQLYGPVLYHRNPIRQVNPRKPPLPPIELFGDAGDPRTQMLYMQATEQSRQMRAADKARAMLLEFYLNFTPTELGLKDESRRAIDEALIKGMGVLWTELYRPKGSGIKMVGSFFDTVDNLCIDVDMESRKDAQWVARRCIHPVWQVERDYPGIPRGVLRGNLESFNEQATSVGEEDADYQRKRGLSNDLLVYWKIYSKMGLGARLSGVPPRLRDTLDQFGDYCYLVVAEGVPYPLNLPPKLTEDASIPAEQILQAIEWPTPFWADDAWPFTEIVFHDVPRQVWPMSHLKPAMGELKFINWTYSFIASKMRNTCRDFIAIKRSAAEELKATILSGQDLSLLEIDHEHGTISEVVQFLQHPSMNGDIWKVIQAVEHNFEQRVGLTELMYGQTTRQLRSASEAKVKADQLRVRPDDMANKVEDAMTEVARKEAIAARWHLQPQDVEPSMGPLGASLWRQLVLTSRPEELFHQLEYRIEAGSARKPNKDRDAANMTQAIQTLFQPLWQYAMQTGDVGPVNKLMVDWSKTLDMDPEGYLIKPPAPPPPPQAPQGAGGPQQQPKEINR
jgi:hypothetical protein